MVRWLPGLFAASVLLASCSRSDRTPVYPVCGQVFDLKQKPAVGALVVFHPVAAGDGQPLKPLGYVDEEGGYQLTTYERGDGAPSGEYLVTIEWRETGPNPFGPNKEGKDRLRGRYSDPETSDLRFTVAEERENVVPAIYLK